MAFGIGLVLTIVGLIGYALSTSWHTQMGMLNLGLAAAGIFLVASAGLVTVTPEVRKAEVRNGLRALAGAVSFFILVIGMLVVMIYFFGHIDDLKPYVPLAISGIVLAAGGFYYGVAYQQDLDLVKLAPAIGFAAADTGPGTPDGQYDIKGTVNGVETLVNLEQGSAGRNSPPAFDLYILCRPANPYGLELKVKPEGIIGRLEGNAPDVQGWDGYSVTASDKDQALKTLDGTRSPNGSAFSGDYGFRSLELKGSEMVFRFSREGHFVVYGVKYLTKLLEDCCALAARLNQG